MLKLHRKEVNDKIFKNKNKRGKSNFFANFTPPCTVEQIKVTSLLEWKIQVKLLQIPHIY